MSLVLPLLYTAFGEMVDESMPRSYINDTSRGDLIVGEMCRLATLKVPADPVEPLGKDIN